MFNDCPFDIRAFKYSSKEFQLKSIPHSSLTPIVICFVNSLLGAGAGPRPQFPITAVVNPCLIPLCALPSTNKGKSE